MAFTASEENYIKCIYHLQQVNTLVSTNDLAAGLQTRAASVTDMLKKLKGKKLLHYQPYQGFKLSNEGKKVALNIIRKHRLWEYFLVTQLNFGWHQVHEIAEQLEHIQSPLLIDKLDAYLSYPRFDPHGDPIPDSNGKMEALRQVNLLEVAEKATVEVTAVASQSTELLELLQHKHIQLGTRLTIVKKFEFDQSVEIRVEQADVFSISKQLAQTLFVKF